MIRRPTTNTPEEVALEHWAASDERAIRKDATIMVPTEIGRAQMRELLITAASAEQLEKIQRIVEPPTSA